MKTIAVANVKGGTGKTTLAVHLATGLAAAHGKTLLIDLDGQANATASLVATTKGALGTAGVLRDGRITADHLVEVEGRGALDLLPSTKELAHIDDELAKKVAGQTNLRRALHRSSDEWDFVVIDCPPNLGTSVLNALCASDGVLVPVLSAHFSITGVHRLEEVLEEIRDRMDINAHTLGYVMFGADPREAITEETRVTLKKLAKDKLFKAEVRVSTAAKSLPGHMEVAWDGADRRGAEDYQAVLKELLQRLGVRSAAKGAA